MTLPTYSRKVCLLGDFAVGKTSLVRRFVHNLFDDKYISTIGVKVSRKTVAVPRKGEIVEVTLMLWDLGGGEEFERVRPSYLRGAAGAVLVCDLTRPRSLTELSGYVEELERINPEARFIIAANKRDLTKERKLAPEKVEQIAEQLKAVCYETSAKTGDEVEKLFHHMGELLVN